MNCIKLPRWFFRLFVAGVLSWCCGSRFGQVFTQINDGVIVTDEGLFSSCAWADADRDGYADLFAGNQDQIRGVFYRNLGDGTFASSILAGGEGSTGAHWGDYDNDGFPDVVRTFPGICGGILLQFSGADDLAFSSCEDGTVAANPVGADFDADGLLDFAVCRDSLTATSGLVIYQNRGSKEFREIILAESRAFLQFAPVWADYDNDGRIDLFVGMVGGDNLLFHNQGDGTLVRVSQPNLSSGSSNRPCAATWGDYDNDGSPDLFVINTAEGHNVLFHNDGGGRFSSVTNQILSPAAGYSWNCAWGDYNNDGFLDLFVANFGDQNSLYRNNGDGSFSQIPAPELINPGTNSTSCAWGDYNNDGFPDLFVTNTTPGSYGRNFLYRNNGNTNTWIKVRCVGTISNRSAIGAKVRVKTRIFGRVVCQVREISGGNGRSQNELTASFGIGDATVVDLVRIEWPSGIVQELNQVSAKQTLTVQEPTAAFLQPEVKDGHVTVAAITTVGSGFEIQASSNLAEWTTLSGLTNYAGRVTFSESAKENRRHFFRMIKP